MDKERHWQHRRLHLSVLFSWIPEGLVFDCGRAGYTYLLHSSSMSGSLHSRSRSLVRTRGLVCFCVRVDIWKPGRIEMYIILGRLDHSKSRVTKVVLGHGGKTKNTNSDPMTTTMKFDLNYSLSILE